MEPKSKTGEEVAFWAFFAFGIFTVLVAFGGGGFALLRKAGLGAGALGYLLIFLGASLAGMLGSLVLIRSRQRR